MEDYDNDSQGKKTNWFFVGGSVSLGVIAVLSVFMYLTSPPIQTAPMEGAAWSSNAEPFSNVDPASLGFISALRPSASVPGAVFGDTYVSGSDSNKPLPTNAWYQNLLIGSTVDEQNKVFQIPYILDTAGPIPGIRTHHGHVQGNDRMVIQTYEPDNGVTLGGVEAFTHHTVHAPSKQVPRLTKLAIELQWSARTWETWFQGGPGVFMRSAVVRGAPYSSMEYIASTPRLFVQRALKGKVVVDQSKVTLECGTGYGHFSDTPVMVNRELEVHFDTSDMTWLIFVSEPTKFVCSSNLFDSNPPVSVAPGVVPPKGDQHKMPFFELRATQPMRRGMMRIAMSNNCTTGQNPIYCDSFKPRDQTDFTALLREHSDLYPTAEADVEFTFPIQSEMEEQLRLIFNWKAASMSNLKLLKPAQDTIIQSDFLGLGIGGTPEKELLMYAIPHHQERLRPIIGSSNKVFPSTGCIPTLHGQACPAIGGVWSMLEHLHRASLQANRVPRTEMIPAIQEALQSDIKYELPPNYVIGAGDTYFSGKMLAKLARILVVAEEVGGVSDKQFKAALTRLKAGTQVWLDGTAKAQLLYDKAWGGMVGCGCDYHWDAKEFPNGTCLNSYPDCPALTDAGQNFGAGFYNDHHFHYGYHIYAAAVASKLDNQWGREYHQHVLTLIRDIANPSNGDNFFPKWRHKDWYLGFSWASGIVTIAGAPYPNGRNQESSSEAIHAYEAVAVYGDVMQAIFDVNRLDPNHPDKILYENSLRVRDMGRLLMATEIRSARTYWQVQPVGTPNVARIYPDSYDPMVVGMMWSMMAQEQTWFGNEPYKSYGIQLLPTTVASEQRDNPEWIKNMLPLYNSSCSNDSKCESEGWSVLTYLCAAEVGLWGYAWRELLNLDPSVFESAGGNGHSLSNSLWYVSTRPAEEGDATL